MNHKEIEIGRIKGAHYQNIAQSCTVEITLTKQPEGLVLSIVGNLWNNKHTDITEGGQMEDTIREALKNYSFGHTDKIRFAKINRSYQDIKKLLDIWDRWHLNDLKAGCEHQRKLLEEKVKYPKHDYEELIKFSEFSKCPECGYAYGSKWLYEELPSDVVQFVKDFAGDQLKTED